MKRRVPHYVRDYRRFVQRLLATHVDRDHAMSQAVGGGFEEMGAALEGVVAAIGLGIDDYLIDVGCGSGRLSNALQLSSREIRYLGTDTVPELLEYAKERFSKDHCRFVQVDCILIPEARGVADIVVFFSVFTHLTHRECVNYLLEAKRVLKPDGKIVVSYIDLGRMRPGAVARFGVSYLAHHVFGRAFKSVATTDAAMRRLAERVDMEVEFLGPAVGQSVCIFSRSQSRSLSTCSSDSSRAIAGGQSTTANYVEMAAAYQAW